VCSVIGLNSCLLENLTASHFAFDIISTLAVRSHRRRCWWYDHTAPHLLHAGSWISPPMCRVTFLAGCWNTLQSCSLLSDLTAVDVGGTITLHPISSTLAAGSHHRRVASPFLLTVGTHCGLACCCLISPPWMLVVRSHCTHLLHAGGRISPPRCCARAVGYDRRRGLFSCHVTLPLPPSFDDASRGPTSES
jgi:hypothetical protein